VSTNTTGGGVTRERSERNAADEYGGSAATATRTAADEYGASEATATRTAAEEGVCRALNFAAAPALRTARIVR
jgi:hypothetical protein